VVTSRRWLLRTERGGAEEKVIHRVRIYRTNCQRTLAALKPPTTQTVILSKSDVYFSLRQPGKHQRLKLYPTFSLPATNRNIRYAHPTIGRHSTRRKMTKSFQLGCHNAPRALRYHQHTASILHLHAQSPTRTPNMRLENRLYEASIGQPRATIIGRAR